MILTSLTAEVLLLVLVMILLWQSVCPGDVSFCSWTATAAWRAANDEVIECGEHAQQALSMHVCMSDITGSAAASSVSCWVRYFSPKADHTGQYNDTMSVSIAVGREQRCVWLSVLKPCSAQHMLLPEPACQKSRCTSRCVGRQQLPLLPVRTSCAVWRGESLPKIVVKEAHVFASCTPHYYPACAPQ